MNDAGRPVPSSMSDSDRMTPAISEPARQLLDFLRNRRSVRDFLPDPLPEDALDLILEAARQAPTAWGRQSCEFLVVTRRETLDAVSAELRAFFRRLMRWRPLLRYVVPQLRDPELDALYTADRLSHPLDEDTLFYGAPAVVFCCANRRNHYGAADAHLAAQNILLAAAALGYGGVFTGSALAADRLPSVRRRLDLPRTHRVHAVCALGVPAETAAATGPAERRPNLLGWIR